MYERLLVAAVMVLVSAGCGSQTAPDIEAERAALLDAATAYHDAAIAKDRQAVVGFYADDAMMVPPNAERVLGIDGVRDYRFGFIENPSAETRFETVKVEVSSGGDSGWTLAMVEVTFDGPDGQPAGDRIRDFHLWKKQADGTWKVVVDIWNSEIP